MDKDRENRQFSRRLLVAQEITDLKSIIQKQENQRALAFSNSFTELITGQIYPAIRGSTIV